jgi:putative transposase
MAKTFTAVYIHTVFSTKGRTASLAEANRAEIFAYLTGIARRRDVTPIRVGGWFDHVHLLLELSPRISLSDLLRDLKCNSSARIHRRWPGFAHFAWQDGFAAFSVSPSRVASVKRYIENQAAHHEGRSYEEELATLFAGAGSELDRRYLD